MPNFQYLSDIHLELSSQYPHFLIPVSAPNLILAGDIGNLPQYDQYLSFLRRQCKRFKRVFLVLGNHDFYDVTHEEGIELARKLTAEEGCKGKLFLLDRDRYDFDDSDDDDDDDHESDDENGEEGLKKEGRSKVTILGCTLHSKIRSENELVTRMKIHDFSRIKDWTTETHNAYHEKDLSWLREEIARITSTSITTNGNETEDKEGEQKRKILVVTHHAPFRHGSSKPEYANKPWNDGFATELLEPESTTADDNDQDEKDKNKILQNVDTWIFGHTHYSTDTIRGAGKVRCVANQRGYVFPLQARAEHAQHRREMRVHDARIEDEFEDIEEFPSLEPDGIQKAGQGQDQKKENGEEMEKDCGKKNPSVLRKLLSFRSDKQKKNKSGTNGGGFRVIYPDPEKEQGHEGDGKIAYDVRRCIEL